MGARFVAAAEVEEGRRLSETVVKQVTGGDMITARFLHQEHFEFKPALKLWLAANHKPTVRGTDHGIWRRIRLVPFEVTIPADEQDKELAAKLRAELAGIFAWAVQGCQEWREQGLGCPEVVLAATESYRGEMDVLGGFLDECCVISPRAEVASALLYEHYTEWCEESGERPESQRKLALRLQERGLDAPFKRHGLKWWRGIRLRSEHDPKDDGDRGDGKDHPLASSSLVSLRENFLDDSSTSSPTSPSVVAVMPPPRRDAAGVSPDGCDACGSTLDPTWCCPECGAPVCEECMMCSSGCARMAPHCGVCKTFSRTPGNPRCRRCRDIICSLCDDCAQRCRRREIQRQEPRGVGRRP
jgi:hypothetical protein